MLTYNDLGRYGRLGNQLFQIASTIGIATRKGYDFGFPEWKNYDHLERFGSTEDIDIQAWFKNPLPIADNEPRGNVFMPWGFNNYYNVPDGTNLQGHMQSEKYFEHCPDLVRHYFEFKKPVTALPDGAIVLHVRRGDYDGSYHPHMQLEYYLKALDNVISERPCVAYIFSDSPLDAFKIFGTAAYKACQFIYITGNHYITDLQLMATGTHFILSNSTLCWWGWWLSKQNGKVIAPSNWFGKHTGLSAADIYTKQMIVI